MNARTISLEIADDGTLTIPVDLTRVLRLVPRQSVAVEARKDALVLVPLPRSGSVQGRQERLNRIGQLLRTALAGVEWADVEAGRRDRCF